ncbi:unnamed protein product [Trifolium pratense]|uniref:Uncharacterized protein n=1 Tax=Trifolium pratense TaxID=57577 RepID=A0ACB0L0C2_TRIPR|nr:unnamed protein product [Trifolium pratense]
MKLLLNSKLLMMLYSKCGDLECLDYIIQFNDDVVEVNHMIGMCIFMHPFVVS